VTRPSPLRAAGPADAARIAAFMAPFHAELGLPFDRARAERLVAEMLASPCLGRLWLVEDGGRAVGYVALALGFSFEYGGRDGLVDELYLEPAARGRGLGRAALAALLAEADALGLAAVHLEVERGNAAAERLYRSLGFGGNDRRLLSRRRPS
jgi:ribosomal protein S18 acetylase RimI-like enzyme